ncbi:signal transduction histidine kinase [Rhizobium skierniewicense]|uniref:histidine kinase n=2 Tax=Rhizobium skierniewicense TaxID=984260 RepID=A0A7W6G295_9HYPH|nr:signal transduction histidine kinase [Rhizobium skierniewicense]
MFSTVMNRTDRQTADPQTEVPALTKGLSGRLLLLTVIFVMIAEVLIFVPSVANMRLSWLRDRLNTAAAAGIVIDGLQTELPRSVQDDTLLATGAKLIALKKDGTSTLLAATEVPPSVDDQYDLSGVSQLEAVRDAFSVLLFGGDRVIRVFDVIGDSNMIIEIVIGEHKLRAAMIAYAGNVLMISVALSLITASLIFVSINRILIRPIRRLTAGMQVFSEQPDDPANVFKPEEGSDELAVAGRHLADMQTQLQKTLKQQKNLADLGLAVSKINHDMRNILSSAQLMSDRLVDVEDPMVRSFAPKLLRTIDRAVGYTSAVLVYGQATEGTPKRRLTDLSELVQDVKDIIAIDPAAEIDLVDNVAPGTLIDADGEQLFRVLYNLCRNAVQALQQASGEVYPDKRLTIAAQRNGDVVSIVIDDNGPGMPQKARENLFSAFRGSARSGGTGLGLVIARELVLAHKGTIALVEKSGNGTQFRIEIPDSPKTDQHSSLSE